MTRPVCAALLLAAAAALAWGWETRRRLTRLECWLFETRVEEPDDDERGEQGFN